MTASKRQKAGGDTVSPHGISFFHRFSMRFLQVCMIVAAVCTFVQLGFFQKRPGIVQIVWMACTTGIILAGSRVRKRLDERPADRRTRLLKTAEGLADRKSVV